MSHQLLISNRQTEKEKIVEESDISTNEPLFYNELPKEKRKELQKEFSKTAEAKKTSRVLIIVVSIFAAIMIAGAIIGVVTGNEGYFVTFPIFLVCILPAVISQQKFEKWLMEEQNTFMKKGKEKKE